MIAGLEEITEGEIKIGDRVVNDLDPKDRDIAMVFQNYALYPHMTVEENIGFGLKLRGVKKAEREEKIKNAARILGISDLLGRRPRALSGGQRQRVALGRAIVRNPNVFLMDEPLSNLDAKLRVQTRAEISRTGYHDDTGVCDPCPHICSLCKTRMGGDISAFDNPCIFRKCIQYLHDEAVLQDNS